MNLALVIIRLATAIVGGYFLAFAPIIASERFGLNGWGYVHLGAPMFLLPITAGLVYWLVGMLPVYKRREGHDRD